MRKQLLAGMILFLAVGFTSCKKDDKDSVRSKVIGKWQVNKIETSVSGKTDTDEYGGSSYLDLKNNEDDDVELSLNGNRTVGTFTMAVGDALIINLTTGEDYDGRVVSVDDKQFVYKANVVGSNPAKTKTFYMSR